MKRFNLNADMAEGYGKWRMGDDDGLLGIIHSANIACGFHAGDYNIMAKVMAKAKAAKVSIGAHPGFDDLHGFGRRPMNLTLNEIENLMAYQIGAALGMANLTGATVDYVKPHGALNNMAAADSGLAGAIARAIKAADRNLILLAPTLSEMVTMGEAAGLAVAQEVFADRAYQADGQLVPRSQPNAIIHDTKIALENCLDMMEDGKIKTSDGTWLAVRGDSICVHGDEPNAIKMAQAIKDGLGNAGFIGCSLREML